MTKEQKDLLLRDLCARLPYGVKVKFNNIHILKLGTHTRVGEYVTDVSEPCKPYLFPLSSMTPKQKAELSILVEDEEDLFKLLLIEVEFYHKHHIDYRGLIPMGLAIDATDKNIY